MKCIWCSWILFWSSNLIRTYENPSSYWIKTTQYDNYGMGFTVVKDGFWKMQLWTEGWDTVFFFQVLPFAIYFFLEGWGPGMAMGRGKPRAACWKISLPTATYTKEGLYLNFYLVIYKVKTYGVERVALTQTRLWLVYGKPYLNATNTLLNLSLIGASRGGSPLKPNPLPSLDGE